MTTHLSWNLFSCNLPTACSRLWWYSRPVVSRPVTVVRSWWALASFSSCSRRSASRSLCALMRKIHTQKMELAFLRVCLCAFYHCQAKKKKKNLSFMPYAGGKGCWDMANGAGCLFTNSTDTPYKIHEKPLKYADLHLSATKLAGKANVCVSVHVQCQV